MTDDWHRGDWMQTYTGRKFYPYDPRPEDIDILDIAHALAMTCRFGGHSKHHYSVAQHSVLVAEQASPANALRALMHDAPEAYIGDLVRPLKHDARMATFMDAEEIVELAICNKFDLPFPIVNREIKALDDRILLDERDQVMTVSDHDWNLPDITPLGVEIEVWSPETARWKFLQAFEEYAKWQKILADLPTICAAELRSMADRMREAAE